MPSYLETYQTWPEVIVNLPWKELVHNQGQFLNSNSAGQSKLKGSVIFTNNLGSVKIYYDPLLQDIIFYFDNIVIHFIRAMLWTHKITANAVEIMRPVDQKRLVWRFNGTTVHFVRNDFLYESMDMPWFDDYPFTANFSGVQDYDPLRVEPFSNPMDRINFALMNSDQTG